MKSSGNSTEHQSGPSLHGTDLGFSLLELVIAVSLLLVLSFLGLSSYRGVMRHTQTVATEQAAETVYEIAYGYLFDNNPKTSPQDAVDTYNETPTSETVESPAIIKTTGTIHSYGIINGIHRVEKPTIQEDQTSQKNKIFVELEMISDVEIKITATYVGTDITAIRETPSVNSSQNGTDKNTDKENSEDKNNSDENNNDNGSGSTDEDDETEPPVVVPSPEPEDKNNDPQIPIDFDKNAISRLTYKCDTDMTGYIAVLNISAGTKVFIKEQSAPETSSTFVNYSNDFGNLTINSEVSDNVELKNHSELLTLRKNVVYEVIVYGAFNVLSSPENSATGDNFSDCLINTGEWGSKSGLEYITYLSADKLTHVPANIPSTVKSLRGAFNNAKLFNDPNVRFWNTSNIEDMSNLFHNATSFDQPIGVWNTSNVKDMSGMFEGAESFNQEIRKWDVKSVISMASMFKNATSFNQNFTPWNAKSVVNVSSMFEGATSFNQDMSGFHTHNVTDMSYMFKNATSFNGKVSSWQTGNVKNMREMFYNAKSFTQKFNGWNVSNVSDHRDFGTGSGIKRSPFKN